MADEIEIIDSTNDTETVAVETEGETAEEKLLKLEETNKKLFKRAKDAEEKLRGLKPKPLEKKPLEVDEDVLADVKELKLSEKKRQFGHRNNLSPEETDRLFRYAGDADPAEALKDPFFQAGLKQFRQDQRAKDAIPSSSNVGRKVDGKTFAEMTPEERKKNWGQVVQKK